MKYSRGKLRSRFANKFVNSLNILRVLAVVFNIFPNIFIHINQLIIKFGKYLKLSFFFLLFSVSFAIPPGLDVYHPASGIIGGIFPENYSFNGTVGIGTASPLYKLSVVGDINASGFVNGSQICIAGDCRTSWPVAGSGGNSSSWNRSGTNVILANLGDNVGIGTDSPNNLLSLVQEGSSHLLNISNGTVDATLYIGSLTDAGKGASIGTVTNHEFRIFTNNTDRIILDESGNVRVVTPGLNWTAKSAWNTADVGSYSAPAFADLDNDGDYDLLIGHSGGASLGYENTGSSESPVWSAKSAWDAPDIGGFANPAFADLDNDGDYDLLIGESAGNSLAYENTGNSTSPTWSANAAWDVPDIGDYSAPAFADLDNDGDYDLIIGAFTGISLGYENTGNSTSPTWSANAAWNTADAGSYSAPAFADLDNDGDYDLIIGEINGISLGYENTGNSTSPTWSAKSAWNTPDVGGYTKPALIDLDNDGDNDLLIGEQLGVSFGYENKKYNTVIYLGNNGNVGIGITNPTQKLFVSGNITATENINGFTVLLSSASNGRFQVGGCNTGSGNCIADSTVPAINIATGDEDLYIEDDLEVDSDIIVGGKVGIGIVSPIGTLHINSSNTLGALRIQNTTGSQLLSLNGSSGNLKLWASNPTKIGNITVADNPRGVYVSGKYAYVVSDAIGDEFEIFDISNPTAPKKVGGAAAGSNANDVFVAGKYAYVVSDTAGDDLEIFDISNASNPKKVGGANAAGGGNAVYVSGKYAYVASTFILDNIEIFDISNPTSPIQIGNATTADAAYDVFVSGKYAYVTSASAGDDLEIFDISNPTAPKKVGGANAENNANSVYISGQYAYVTSGTTTGNSKLEIFNISNPSDPSRVADISTTSIAHDVYVSGKYAYVVDDLQIFDVFDPTNPVLVTNKFTTSTDYAVYISGKYAYVAADGGSNVENLDIYDISGIDAPAANIGNIEASDITVTENMDIGNNLYVRNGINVGPGGLLIDGGLSVANKSIYVNETSGNVGIGTAKPVQRLEVKTSSEGNVMRLGDGTETCDLDPDASSITQTCSSDERLKTNIKHAEPVINYLTGLQIRDFAVKSSGENTTGVIAQEIMKDYPELVSVGDNGYYMVKEISSWKLIKAIQEQQEQINKLQKNILELKEEIIQLKYK